MSTPSKEQRAAWHADPANWRLGVFYYNKQDPRLLPPKRIPALGWTINFANPRSILLLAVLLAAVLALVWLIERYVPG
jgi:uncharacterized membrane protein